MNKYEKIWKHINDSSDQTLNELISGNLLDEDDESKTNEITNQESSNYNNKVDDDLFIDENMDDVTMANYSRNEDINEILGVTSQQQPIILIPKRTFSILLEKNKYIDKKTGTHEIKKDGVCKGILKYDDKLNVPIGKYKCSIQYAHPEFQNEPITSEENLNIPVLKKHRGQPFFFEDGSPGFEIELDKFVDQLEFTFLLTEISSKCKFGRKEHGRDWHLIVVDPNGAEAKVDVKCMSVNRPEKINKKTMQKKPNTEGRKTKKKFVDSIVKWGNQYKEGKINENTLRKKAGDLFDSKDSNK